MRDSIRRSVLAAVLAVVRHKSAAGIVTEHARVDCSATGVGYHVDITWTLASLLNPDEARPLAIETRGSPALVIESVIGDDVIRVDGLPLRRPAYGVIFLELRKGAVWAGQEVHLRMRWLPGVPGDLVYTPYLILLACLPSIMGQPEILSASGHLQSTLRLAHSLPGGLVGGSVGVHSADMLADSLQLVFAVEPAARDESARATTTPPVALVGSGVEGLDPDTSAVIRDSAVEMISFIGRELERPFPGSLVVAVESDRTRLGTDPGACLLTGTDWWVPDSRGNIRKEPGICTLVAGAWWGCGCRLGEPGATVMQVGIGSALSLLWLQERGQRSRAIRLLEEQKARLAPLRGTHQREADIGIDLGLALADDFMARGPVLRRLRERTRELWGRVVPAKTLLQDLSEAGASIPPAVARINHTPGAQSVSR